MTGAVAVKMETQEVQPTSEINVIVNKGDMVTETEMARREQTESLSNQVINTYVEELINDIKNAGDWFVVSMTDFIKTHELRTASDRYMIIERLQSHPNIISRPKPAMKEERNKDEEVPHTVPIEYKWVSEKEKKQLGFDGVVARKIVGERSKWVEKTFIEEDEKEYKETPADIVGLTEYLYGQGCFDGWGLVEPLKSAIKTGIPIKNILNILEIMQLKHGLVIGTYIDTNTKNNKPKARLVAHIANSEEEYQELCKYAQDNESIEPVDREIKRRRRRKTEDAVQAMYEQEKSDQKQVAQEPSNVISITEQQPVVITGALPDKTVDMDEELKQITKELVQIAEEKYKTYIQNKINSRVAEYEKIVQKSNDVGQKLISEKEQLQAKLDKYITENVKLRNQVESAVKYNNDFVTNAASVLNLYMGRMMMWIGEFTQLQRYQLHDETVVNSKRSEAMKLIVDMTDNITNYKPEDSVPSLIK